jgi:hypothetical protein
MAELFDATKQNISLHLKNFFADGLMDAAATVKESLTVQTEGTRKVQRSITLDNLDAILPWVAGCAHRAGYSFAAGRPRC